MKTDQAATPAGRLAILNYVASNDSTEGKIKLMPECETLSRNDTENLRRIIVVQLPRYAKILDSRLQPQKQAIQCVEDYLSPTGFPRGLLHNHIGEERHPFRSTEMARSTTIPSNLAPGVSFTATYYEARTLVSPWSIGIRDKFRNPVTYEFELICASTGHQIQLHEWHQSRRQGPLMIVPRNCSFWCQKGLQNNWDSMSPQS